MSQGTVRRIERVISVVPLHGQGGDLEWWLSRPAEERLEAIEQARRLTHGPDYASRGLQRVLEVARREGR